MKRFHSLLHLLFGICLLVIGGYFVAGLAHNGKAWWRQIFVVSRPAKPGKRDTAGDDPILGAANAQVYGVLAQKGSAAPAEDTEEDAPPTSSSPPPLVDHAYAVEAGEPNHFLHRRLSIKSCRIFEFEIPPHAFRPELRGTYKSVATQRSLSGGPAVEVLLLNEEEYADYSSHRPWSPTFALDPASSGQLHWALVAPAINSKKYYLMVRNSAEAQGPSTVDADFTASFE